MFAFSSLIASMASYASSNWSVGVSSAVAESTLGPAVSVSCVAALSAGARLWRSWVLVDQPIVTWGRWLAELVITAVQKPQAQRNDLLAIAGLHRDSP